MKQNTTRFFSLPTPIISVSVCVGWLGIHPLDNFSHFFHQVKWHLVKWHLFPHCFFLILESFIVTSPARSSASRSRTPSQSSWTGWTRWRSASRSAHPRRQPHHGTNIVNLVCRLQMTYSSENLGKISMRIFRC